jgi:cell division protein FtsW
MRKCKSPFGSYLTIGLGFLIVSQALIHIMVNVGMFPSTGQTLPMFSWGGMSIMITSLCFGIILNVSREVKKEKKDKIVQQKTSV